MRMWNINPKKWTLSLLGEHFEIHKAIGNLKNSRTWACSLTKEGFLEPQNAEKRHNQLVKEITKHGFKHKSSLKTSKGKVDKKTKHKRFEKKMQKL